MNRHRIRLTLAPAHDKPDGDPRCGYEFEAPLNAVGELDVNGWKEAPDTFPVTRFWAEEEKLHGKLVNRCDRFWYFHYQLHEEPDEFAHQFDREIFREGDYVSLRDHGGDMHLFLIDTVSAVANA